MDTLFIEKSKWHEKMFALSNMLFRIDSCGRYGYGRLCNWWF